MAADAKRAAERAARITELRGEIRDPETGKKLSQERLASEIHVSSRSVQNWERGGELGDQNRKVLAEYFTSKHGRLITEDFLEYGTMRRERARTPEPLRATVPDDTAALLLQRLDSIDAQLKQMQLDSEARAMEVRQQIVQGLEPLRELRTRRPA